VSVPNFTFFYFSSSDFDWFLYHSSVVKVLSARPCRQLPTKIPMSSHLCSDIRLSPRRLSGYGAPIFTCHRSAVFLARSPMCWACFIIRPSHNLSRGFALDSYILFKGTALPFHWFCFALRKERVSLSGLYYTQTRRHVKGFG
jgi:hypothetical protein